MATAVITGQTTKAAGCDRIQFPFTLCNADLAPLAGETQGEAVVLRAVWPLDLDGVIGKPEFAELVKAR